MRIGDLVEYIDDPDQSQGRTNGIVTGTDIYKPRTMIEGIGDSKEPIVEVLWNNGLGWILQHRVRQVR